VTLIRFELAPELMSIAPVSSKMLPTDWASSFKVFIFNVSDVFLKEVTKIGFLKNQN
jgi:hypothetical protein